MERRFRDWGYTGAFVTIAYYRYDTGCTASLGGDGSHTRHYATGHDATGGHTGQTDIRHLGYHLAWFIYDHYSKAGVAVDVVGHSMGPLLIQYALAQVARHHPDFPPRLLVEDVVSLAGPYTGARSIINTCPTRQCSQMRHGSTFLAWLRTYAANPQGEGGTDWTAISSVDDEYVSSGSGVAMGACHKLTYLTTSNVRHADLLHDASSSMTADVRRSDCPGRAGPSATGSGRSVRPTSPSSTRRTDQAAERSMTTPLPLDTRQARIARRLLETTGPASVDALATELKLTDRMVRYNLASVDTVFAEHGLRLARQSGIGIWVEGSPAARQGLLDALDRSTGPACSTRRIGAAASCSRCSPRRPNPFARRRSRSDWASRAPRSGATCAMPRTGWSNTGSISAGCPAGHRGGRQRDRHARRHARPPPGDRSGPGAAAPRGGRPPAADVAEPPR